MTQDRPGFTLSQDRRGRYRWAFIAANHETIAVPGKGFEDEDACRLRIERVQHYAPAAPIVEQTEQGAGRRSPPGAVFELYRNARQEYRWRLRAPDGQILAIASEGYKNKADCEHAIGLLKGYAQEEASPGPAPLPAGVCPAAPAAWPWGHGAGRLIPWGQWVWSPYGWMFRCYGYRVCC